MFRLAQSQDSQSLASGRPTGIRVIKCQLSTIFFRAMINQWSILSKLISCMLTTSHLQKTIKFKLYYLKELKISNLNQLELQNQIPLKRVSISELLITLVDQQSLSRKKMLFMKCVIALFVSLTLLTTPKICTLNQFVFLECYSHSTLWLLYIRNLVSLLKVRAKLQQRRIDCESIIFNNL